MKARVKVICGLVFITCGLVSVRAQTTADTSSARINNEPHVALTEQATAFDVAGRVALGARLVTTQLNGTTDAPVRNVRLVVENRGQFFYNYVSGWATFYDGQGVRCGEGLWRLEAFAPGESAEVDTPGLRLTCAPATWRVVALNLLTRTSDVAKPGEATTPTPAAPASNTTSPAVESAPVAATPRLEININGKTLPLQLGNPVEIVVGKERVNIVVRPAP